MPSAVAPGRRDVLAGLAAAAGAAGLAAARPTSALAADFSPQPDPATPLPTAEELHLIRRWSYGYRPAQLAAVRAAGGVEAWFEAQLSPESVAESERAAQIDDWWPCIAATPEQIVARDRDRTERSWVAMANYARFAMLKRMESERQLLELMTEFWEDHLYVPLDDDGVYPFRIDFGHGIRQRALTSFEQLLQFSTVHPAMSCSLDNAGSTKTALNENLGRELLELHTVGQGNYTEDDVKNSARLLTGYRVKMWTTWDTSYRASDHYVGPVRIIDFTHANDQADGREAVRAYLSYLAHHPRTAERLARKLARRFVSDDPSPALVDHLAQVYLQNDTQVKPVLRALFAHEEYRSSAGAKVKTPTDEVVSVFRSLEATFSPPAAGKAGEEHAANAILWVSESIGSTPWSHPRPDGPPAVNSAWVSPSRFLGSWKVHWEAGNAYWPDAGIAYRSGVDRLLPDTGMPLARFVDRLSRTLTGEASSAALVQACCITTGYAASTTVSAGHELLGWKLGRLLALVLDQPNFYLR